MTSLFLGSDHAGFLLKKKLIERLKESPISDVEIHDCGCESENSVDYPIFAEKVAHKVVEKKGLGVLICGSGIGMCIAANKVSGIRAASAWDVTSSRLAKEHNNANILCLGGRLIGPLTAEEMVRTWVLSTYETRHDKRLSLIKQLEEKHGNS